MVDLHRRMGKSFALARFACHYNHLLGTDAHLQIP
jgi:hypothetical protein